MNTTSTPAVIDPVHLPVSALLHAGRTLRGWSRTPAVLIQSLIMPVAMLLTIAFMFGNTIEAVTGGSAVQGLTPLMLITGPMFAGTASAAGLVTERRNGLLTRFRTLPGPRIAPLAGRILAETLRGTVGAVLILLVGFLIGYRLDDPWGLLGVLGLAALVSLAFSSVLTWVGMVAATPEATVAALPVMMILMFCNTGFMPVEGFPSYMRGIVRNNPLSAVVDAMDACAGNGGPVLPAIIWTLALTVVGLTLLTLRMRAPERHP